MQAVISGDIISSSEYSEKLLETVIKNLQDEFDSIAEEEAGTFAVWRGDSFQGVLYDARDALNTAIKLKALVNQTSTDNTEKGVKSQAAEADVRIATAAGIIENPHQQPASSNEETYVRSGKKLDAMSKQKRTIVADLPDESLNRELDVELNLLEFVMERWSVASAQLIYCKLSGMDDHEIAEYLEISLPAVYKRKKTSGWKACKLVLDRYEELLATNSGNQ